MTQNDVVAQNIIRYRKAKKLTQSDVADYLGITRAGYANYEQGLRTISFETALKLGELFGVSTNALGYVDAEEFEINPHEEKLVKAYRNNPDLQPAIDKLLQIDEADNDNQTIIYRAAKSTDNHPAEITTTTKDFSKIPPTKHKL